MPHALFPYLIKLGRGPLRDPWIPSIKTSEKQKICLPSPSSILTSLHTLILHTDPPIFPLPDLSLIFIILCNAPDSFWQERQPYLY